MYEPNDSVKWLQRKSKQAVEARNLKRFGNAHIGIKGGKGYKMSEGGTKLTLKRVVLSNILWLSFHYKQAFCSVPIIF